MKGWIALFAILALVNTYPSALAIAEEKPIPASTKEVISVAGEWEGEWRATEGATGRMPFRLQQEGERVWGEYDSPDTRVPYFAAKVEGTLKGEKLSLTVPQFSYSYFNLTVDGDRIDGTGSARANIKFSVTLRKTK